MVEFSEIQRDRVEEVHRRLSAAIANVIDELAVEPKVGIHLTVTLTTEFSLTEKENLS